MITSILFILLGVKLNILNGWYLGLIILKIFLDMLHYFIRMCRITKDYYDGE